MDICAMIAFAFVPGRSILPQTFWGTSVEVTDGWYIGKYPEACFQWSLPYIAAAGGS